MTQFADQAAELSHRCTVAVISDTPTDGVRAEKAIEEALFNAYKKGWNEKADQVKKEIGALFSSAQEKR